MVRWRLQCSDCCVEEEAGAGFRPGHASPHPGEEATNLASSPAPPLRSGRTSQVTNGS